MLAGAAAVIAIAMTGETAIAASLRLSPRAAQACRVLDPTYRRILAMKSAFTPSS